jgi:hypothetical protein
LGKKKEANLILAASIVYTIITIVILNLINSTNSSGAMFFNLIGGSVLSHGLFSVYIPNEEQFEKKKIWKPLIISIIITIPFILALLYSN